MLVHHAGIGDLCGPLRRQMGKSMAFRSYARFKRNFAALRNFQRFYYHPRVAMTWHMAGKVIRFYKSCMRKGWSKSNM